MPFSGFDIVMIITMVSVVFFVVLVYLLVSRNPIDSGWILATALFWEVLWSAVLIDVLSFRNGILFIVAFLLMIGIVAICRRNEILSELLRNKVVLLAVIFLLYAFLSSAWSVNPEYGQWKLQLLAIRGLFYGLIFFIVFRAYGYFTWKPVIVAGITFCIAMLAYGVEIYADRLSIYGFNPIWAARLALIVASIALCDTTLRLFVRIPVFGFAMWAFWITQSRGPLVAFLLGLVIVFMERIFFGKNARLALRFGGVILFLVLVSFGMFLAIPDLHVQFGQSTEFRLEVLYNPSALLIDPNFISRVDLISRAAILFAEYPLAGVGIGGYAVRLLREYPHNIVMEVASELGLIGLFLWVVIIIFMLRATQSNRLLRVVFIQSIFYAMFSGDLGFNSEWLLFGIVAIAVVPSKNEQKLKSSTALIKEL